MAAPIPTKAIARQYWRCHNGWTHVFAENAATPQHDPSYPVPEYHDAALDGLPLSQLQEYCSFCSTMSGRQRRTFNHKGRDFAQRHEVNAVALRAQVAQANVSRLREMGYVLTATTDVFRGGVEVLNGANKGLCSALPADWDQQLWTGAVRPVP